MKRARRVLALPALALILLACTPQAQDDLARDAAKQTITPILAQRYPGVPVEPVANCVIDNATAGEILTLAAGTLTGTTTETTRTLNTVLARPGTQVCLAEKAVSGIVAGGLSRRGSGA